MQSTTKKYGCIALISILLFVKELALLYELLAAEWGGFVAGTYTATFLACTISLCATILLFKDYIRDQYSEDKKIIRQAIVALFLHTQHLYDIANIIVRPFCVHIREQSIQLARATFSDVGRSPLMMNLRYVSALFFVATNSVSHKTYLTKYARTTNT